MQQLTSVAIYVPLYKFPDFSNCEVIIPTVIVNKEATLMITLKDRYNDFVIDQKELLTVIVLLDKFIEDVFISEVGGGRYKASFTASRCGYYTISIIVDGHHIPGSPYKYVSNYELGSVEQFKCMYVPACIVHD